VGEVPGFPLLSVPPGLRPGSVNPSNLRDAIGVALELPCHVDDGPGEILLVQGCRVETSRPAHRARNAAVGAYRSDTLGQSYEVAQARIRPKAHDQMESARIACRRTRTPELSQALLIALSRSLAAFRSMHPARFQVCQVTWA